VKVQLPWKAVYQLQRRKKKKKGFVGAVEMKREERRQQQQMPCPRTTGASRLSALPALPVQAGPGHRPAVDTASGTHAKEKSSPIPVCT